MAVVLMLIYHNHGELLLVDEQFLIYCNSVVAGQIFLQVFLQNVLFEESVQPLQMRIRLGTLTLLVAPIKRSARLTLISFSIFSPFSILPSCFVFASCFVYYKYFLFLFRFRYLRAYILFLLHDSDSSTLFLTRIN